MLRNIVLILKSTGLPIVDFHNHLTVADMAADRQFENLTRLWLSSNPYKYRLKQECTRFSKGVLGLPAQHARMEAAGFDWKKGKAAEKAFAEYNKLKKSRDPARFRDVVTIMPPYKGDAITHRSLYNNLAKSEIGKEAIDYISSGKCMLEISYTDDAPKCVRGESFGHSIIIYAKNTRTIKLTAKTIIHEVTPL